MQAHRSNRGLGRTFRVALLGASAMAAVGGPALAQSTQPPAVEEVIVTALKRATNLQDTPIAISAVTSETIANSGVQSIADLGATVPGLTFVNSGPSFSRVVIRGINAAGEPTVGVYYDETPVTGSIGAGNNAGGSTPELRLFDVDRVEVLRGPQGTLYGAGSMGGTLRTIYKKPTYEFEAAADGSLSKTEGAGDWNYEAQGMVNIPLAQDKAALRVVGFYRNQAGYIDNTFLNIKDINETETYGGRALLRVEPTENFTLDFAAYINRTDAESPSWYPDLGEFKSDSRTQQPLTDDLDLYSVTGNLDLGVITAVGSFSYMKRELVSTQDVTQFIEGFRTPARCQALSNKGAPCDAGQLSSYYAYVDTQHPAALNPQQDMDTYTAELRFTSNYEAPIQWTLGGFFSDRKTSVWNPQVGADPVTGALLRPEVVMTGRNIDDTLKQYAGFGELTFDVTDKLNLTAGARYFKYSKDIIGETLVGSLLVGAVVTPPTRVESEEKGWMFRFNGSYQFTPDIMAYAEASQGYRPGGANQVLGLPGNLTPYESDQLWNYELGVKTAFWNRRATLNADIFQIDWSDMQVRVLTPNGAFSYIGNAGKARIRGIEAEGAVNPITGLSITGNFSLMEAELTQDQPGAGGAIPNAGLKGDRIPYVPKFQAGAAVQYVWPVAEGLNGFSRLDVNHVGSSWNELRTSYVYARKLKAYELVNARVGVEADNGDWGAYLFVTNLFNDEAILSKTAGATSVGRTYVFSAQPRTIGVNLRKAFR
ncbi:MULTISPECIES: TonB-dependent receptor [Phenylobacterium]|uniref:Outer membrane receptor protein involved in Fe transport n=1 Tax=Phenylobacterium koreense TaxID=266125 RepID=A0ABV2EFH8_9CAUL